jgi:uncharacterized phage protein gp47/JayE
MPYLKDFDTLFARILTDYRNQFPEADLSKGSLIFIKSACQASALWGLYRYQDWIAAQIFADTADTDNMEHYVWERGLSRKVGETNEELLARYLDYIRRPPAGGNKYDYVKWALSIGNVAKAYPYPLGQGLGTMDVVILAVEDSTGSEIPSSHTITGTATSVSSGKLVASAANFSGALPARIGDIAINEDTAASANVTAVDSATQLALDADIITAPGQAFTLKSLCAQVLEYIDDVRPTTAKWVRVLPPTVIPQDVTIAVSGDGLDTVAIAAEIAAYMNSLQPKATLYRNRIISIAIQAGSEDAVLSTPSANVTPADYGMIRPGTITVDAV